MAEWTFLVDESVSNKIAQHLRSLGFEAEFVKDALDEGAGDFEDVVSYARERGHVIVTEDDDFLQVDVERHHGVFIVDQEENPHEVAFAIQDVVDAYGDPDQFYVDFASEYL